MQDNDVIRKASMDSTATLNNVAETNLNELIIPNKKTGGLAVGINKQKKIKHESCKGCDGMCCSKNDKKPTD